MDENVFVHALTAVCAAMAEQLDLDRFIDALHAQHKAYAEDGRPEPQTVAAMLGHVGKAMYEMAEVRRSKRGPQH